MHVRPRVDARVARAARAALAVINVMAGDAVSHVAHRAPRALIARAWGLDIKALALSKARGSPAAIFVDAAGAVGCPALHAAANVLAGPGVQADGILVAGVGLFCGARIDRQALPARVLEPLIAGALVLPDANVIALTVLAARVTSAIVDVVAVYAVPAVTRRAPVALEPILRCRLVVAL